MPVQFQKEEGYPIDCELLPFFELGSCHYDYYLVNIRLPVHEGKGMNVDIGLIKDMWLVVSICVKLLVALSVPCGPSEHFVLPFGKFLPILIQN